MKVTDDVHCKSRRSSSHLQSLFAYPKGVWGIEYLDFDLGFAVDLGILVEGRYGGYNTLRGLESIYLPPKTSLQVRSEPCIGGLVLEKVLPESLYACTVIPSNTPF